MSALTKAKALDLIGKLAHLKFFPTDPRALDNLATLLIEVCRQDKRWPPPLEQAQWLIENAKWLNEYPGPAALFQDPHWHRWKREKSNISPPAAYAKAVLEQQEHIEELQKRFAEIAAEKAMPRAPRARRGDGFTKILERIDKGFSSGGEDPEAA